MNPDIITEPSQPDEARTAIFKQVEESANELSDLLQKARSNTLKAFVDNPGFSDGDDVTAAGWEWVIENQIDPLINIVELTYDAMELAVAYIQRGDFGVATGYLAMTSLVLDQAAAGLASLRPKWQTEELKRISNELRVEKALDEVEKALTTGAISSAVVESGVETINGRPVCSDCGKIHPRVTLNDEVLDMDDAENWEFPPMVIEQIYGLLDQGFDVTATSLEMTGEEADRARKEMGAGEDDRIVGYAVSVSVPGSEK